MKRFRLYILDLDGTIYRGDQAIPHAAEVVAELRAGGAAIRYLTNNSGQTREYYEAKLNRLGFPCKQEEIYSSAIGAAHYCQEHGYVRVFYVGEPGLRETLESAGIGIVNGGGQGKAVLTGICRSFTYGWMNDALQQILEGAAFLATNTDATYPIEDGKVEPGAGAVVASIQTCSGVSPYVIGKPNPYLIELTMREAGVSPAETLAVGDRYETDIVSARNAGVDAHLVLTGVTKTVPEGLSWSEDLRGLLRF